MENDVWRQNINPDDFDILIEERSAVLNSKESNNRWVGEYRLKKADGSYAIVIDKTFAIKDEDGRIIRMVGALQDITKQRAEEERLRLMESVILNTNDSILITEAEPYDLPGPRILFVNKAFSEMTGYSAEELIGKTPRILQNEDTDRKELDRLYSSLKNWEPCEVTVSNSRKNGEKFWLNMQITPIANDKGWFTHWIAVERDVTIQKEAEEEKEKLLKELVANNLELKQFSYITSHNLRAPLTNLVSICNIIKLYSYRFCYCSNSLSLRKNWFKNWL
jgi:PAS domain S-box-containing protein